MFRFASRQTFKTLRSPLRSSLRCSLRYSSCPDSRHIHNGQTPFCGPPSYETVARRFSSSHPNPQAYFLHKRQQEAKERGEFVDIHDIGGENPNDYDILLCDLTDKKLRTEVAKITGIEYHAKASDTDANKVVEIGHGYIYGRKFRTIFPCVVSRAEKAHWVFFVVDSGAPLTYLSAQVGAPTH
jgi:hypothetical protein